MARSDLEAILASLATDTAEFNADDFRAQVLAAYDEDISVRDTAVQNRDSALESAQSEITKWKVKNYDLLMKLPQDNSGGNAPGQPSGTDTDETNVSVADLFGKKD